MKGSPLRWIGGKYHLAKTISRLIPEHARYVEVFGGAGHVLFQKAPSKNEVLNDINRELVNFFREVASNSGSLEEICDFALYSRWQFYELAKMDPDKLDPTARAWRFFYLNRCCFGGRMRHLSFGRRMSGANAMPQTWKARLQMAAARLQPVIIECLPWHECIRQYDKCDTFFYVDPPYYGHEKDYGKTFRRSDFHSLAQTLARIKGHFILSINDTPETRNIFKDFEIIKYLQCNYSINKDKCLHKPELLFANFDPQPGKLELKQQKTDCKPEAQAS